MLVTLPKAAVTLIGWNIVCIKLPDGGFAEVFSGYSVDDCLGRLSTPIQEFDKETGHGRTRSGSTYSVVGVPGMPHDDAIYVLESQFGRELVTNELFSEKETDILNFKYPITGK